MARVTIYPFQWNPTTRELRYSTKVRLRVAFETPLPQGSAGKAPAAESGVEGVYDALLQGIIVNYRGRGKARNRSLPKAPAAKSLTPEDASIKIEVKRDGIYRVTYEDLFDTGVDAGSIDPRTFQLFHRGTEIALKVVSQAEGLVVAPDRGALGAFSPSGLGYPWEHEMLSKQVFSALFERGETILGSIATGSKIAAYARGVSGETLKTFTLFGDPAARLKMGRSEITPLTLGPGPLPEGEAGVPYQASLEISGGVPPYTVRVVKGAPPPGLSLDPAGVLAGTPKKAGKKRFIVEGADQGGSSARRTFKLKVFPELRIATRGLKKGRTGKPYRKLLKAAGGKKPYAWSSISGSLPEGLTLDRATGKITGIPAASGGFELTFRAADPLGGAAQRSFTLTIRGN